MSRPNYLNTDQVAELLGVPSMDKYDDSFNENNYCKCSEELQDQGKCECGFDDERTEYCNRYFGAVDRIAENLLKEHGLMLVETKQNWIKKLAPIISWKDAADHLRMTINGVGEFHFNTLQEFLDSGPYTPFMAVIEHLQWIKSWYRVYGAPNAKSQLERDMRG